MVHLYSLFVFVLTALGVTTAIGEESGRCFSEGAPCSGTLDLLHACEDKNYKVNATCQCISGYIPLEQGCLWCRKKWGDIDSLLKLAFDQLADAKAECSRKKIPIAPIPSDILKSMSAYNATNTLDHPKKTKTITDFSDLPTITSYFDGSTRVRTAVGGGDHTPTQWLTDTRNPNDVPLQTAQADDAKRVGVPLGFAAAAVLGLL